MIEVISFANVAPSVILEVGDYSLKAIIDAKVSGALLFPHPAWPQG
jgi:hypothetical protein